MEISTNPENQMLSQGRFAYGVDEKNQVGISLKTQEGDTVNLTFNSANGYSFQSGSETKSQDGAVTREFSAKAVSASNYSISVQGDLNEKEMAAIKKMTDAMTPIAQNFFGNSDFNFEEAAQSIEESLGEIRSANVRLEQTVTETFTQTSVSGLERRDNSQPSATAAGNIPPSPAAEAEPPTSENMIRDPEALAKAVVGSVFQGEGEKAGKNDPAFLQTLGDLVKFLQSQLSQFFTPLKTLGEQQVPAPVEPAVKVAPQAEAKSDPASKPIDIAA